jgi:hypothetical protein
MKGATSNEAVSKAVFVIAIRMAGSNPETRKSLDCFTLRVRNDENHPNIPTGMRGTPPKSDF